MHVILIARKRHHKKYFNFLARHCSVSMKVYTVSMLPRVGWSRWWRVVTAGRRNMIEYHLKNKMRSRHFRLNQAPAGRARFHSLWRMREEMYWKAHERIYHLKARKAFIQFLEVFSKEATDAIVVWNGGGWFFRAAIEAAREKNIPVFFSENGLLPNTTTFDPKGINYENSMPREAAFYRNLTDYRSNFEENLVPRLSARAAKAKVVALPEKYVFVPLQVNTDSQIILNSPWIRDMYHLLEILRGVMGRIRDRDVSLVIKQHPSCRCNYDAYHHTLGDRILFANGNNTQDLIQGAQAVITVNSTVGIESLLLKKKVIVLGKAFYALEDLVLAAGDEAALVRSLDLLPTWQPDELLRLKFLSYLADVYCIPGSWRTPDRRHCEKIQERLHRVLVEGHPL